MRSIILSFTLLTFSSFALADLEPWVDYEPSEEVYSVTTVKVKSNMEDAYLEGLANTWVTGNDVAVKLGHIESYAIYRSQLSESGDFNLILLVKFANTDAMAPNKARYEEFIKAFTKKRSDETSKFAQTNYPAMREITGTYMMREIKLLKK